MATSGDRYLATSGDFFMATDNIAVYDWTPDANELTPIDCDWKVPSRQRLWP